MFSSPVGVKGNSMQQSSKLAKNVTSVQGDVSNLSDLDKLYATVKQQKGRIDILFANAGLWEFLRLEEITEAHFDKLFRAFVHGTKSRVSTSKFDEFANATIRDGSGSVLGQVYRKGTNDMKKGFIPISVVG